MMRFDRFTERAQEAAQRAAEIIQRYGHNQIDTEHILLALIEQPQGVVTQILELLKVDSANLIERLDYILRTSPKASIFGGGAGQIFITPRVKRIIDVANDEASKLKDEYISTEHIFLAILTEKNTPAARLLETSGITRERVYDAINQLRGGQRVTDPQAETRYRTLEKYSTGSHPAGTGGQVGSRHRTGEGDPAGDADPLEAHQEQPGINRRGRGGQNGHCGRVGRKDCHQ